MVKDRHNKSSDKAKHEKIKPWRLFIRIVLPYVVFLHWKKSATQQLPGYPKDFIFRTPKLFVLGKYTKANLLPAFTTYFSR